MWREDFRWLFMSLNWDIMPLILSSLHSHHVSVRGFKIICNCLLIDYIYEDQEIIIVSVAYSSYRPKQLLSHTIWLSHYWTAGSSYAVVSLMQYKIGSWIESWYLCFQSNHVCYIAVIVAMNTHTPLVVGKWTTHLLNCGCIVLLWHTDFVEPFFFVVNLYDTIWRTVIWDPGL